MRPAPFDPARLTEWERLVPGPPTHHALPGAGRTTTLAPGQAPSWPPGAGISARPLSLSGDQVGWELQLPLGPADRVFGGGECFDTPELRGTARVLLNRETSCFSIPDAAYLSVPFFWCTGGWGLVLHGGAPALADAGRSDAGTFRLLVAAPTVKLTVLRGSPTVLLRQYAAHTGRTGEWPDWAFGTWMSRASYMSAAELHGVLDDLQGARCPVDVLHVDAWLAGNVFRDFTCSWEVDRRRFPAGWTDALRARGVRVSLWLNPFVLEGTAAERQLRDGGLLLRGPGGEPALTSDRFARRIVDFTNPGAVAWWGERVRTLLREERPDALKLDFGEEIRLDAVCHDGRPGLELRNSYALLYHRATAAGIPAGHPVVPFFCRSGTAGSQATPCHWVGDTPSTWAGLRMSLSACLSLSLSGFPLVTADAGGFFTPASKEIPARILDGEPLAFTADVEPELFGRWAQWAAYCPVTRFHGVGRREPTAYPEPWRAAAITALQRRRELLPHLRSALAEARATGLPMMRPTALTHPHDPLARRAWHQYQLGPGLIVAPVLEPGGEATVWLPEGDWEPVHGAPPVVGPGLHRIRVSADAFPVYRRCSTD